MWQTRAYNMPTAISSGQMLSKTEATANKFVRDGIAWISYVMIAAYCYYGACLGPMMPFLRAEMNLNYTMASYHFTAVSFGVVVAGSTGERWMRMLGKVRCVWFAAIGLTLAIISLINGKNPTVTICSAFAYGLCGSTMSQTLCTLLASRFQALRAVAFTEANIAASLCCSLAPMAISKFSETPLGWRFAYLLPIIIFAICFLLGRQSVANAANLESETKAAAKGSLPFSYWICWVLIFLSVASEWSIIYWSADFMENVAKLSRKDAAASVSSFLIAMVSGRILGSRLAREMKPQTLLRAASIIAISGFFLFWTSTNPTICVTGLFFTGLGIANFYPQTMSLAISRARGLTNLATARISLSAGCSTLTAPLLLGIAAEREGILQAYGIIAALLLLSCLVIFLPFWSEPTHEKEREEQEQAQQEHESSKQSN